MTWLSAWRAGPRGWWPGTPAAGTRQAAARIQRLLDDALAKGARLVTGGRPDGLLMNATVVDDVTLAMDLFH